MYSRCSGVYIFKTMSLVTIQTAFNPAAAQVVRSSLEAAGFHPVVTHELSALSLDGYALAAGGILVQVPAEEAEFPVFDQVLADGVERAIGESQL